MRFFVMEISQSNGTPSYNAVFKYYYTSSNWPSTLQQTSLNFDIALNQAWVTFHQASQVNTTTQIVTQVASSTNDLVSAFNYLAISGTEVTTTETSPQPTTTKPQPTASEGVQTSSIAGTSPIMSETDPQHSEVQGKTSETEKPQTSSPNTKPETSGKTKNPGVALSSVPPNLADKHQKNESSTSTDSTFVYLLLAASTLFFIAVQIL